MVSNSIALLERTEAKVSIVVSKTGTNRSLFLVSLFQSGVFFYDNDDLHSLERTPRNTAEHHQKLSNPLRPHPIRHLGSTRSLCASVWLVYLVLSMSKVQRYGDSQDGMEHQAVRLVKNDSQRPLRSEKHFELPAGAGSHCLSTEN